MSSPLAGLLRSTTPIAVLAILTASSAVAEDVAAASSAAAEPDVVARVQSFLTAHDWRTALEQARAHAVANPDNAEADSLLGEALLRAGRLSEVAPVLEPHARASQATARGYVSLGRLRDAEGRREEALAWMEAALAADAEDREVLYWAAEATETRAQAIERLERYLERSEGDDPERIESARSGIRNLEALGTRRVWVEQSRPARLALELDALWNTDDGAITGWVVEATLGESAKRVPLLLDSGASGLTVLARVARKRGFERLAMQTLFGGGGEGRHETERGIFPRLALGELSFTEVLATTTTSEIHPTGRFHGLLGLGAFDGYTVTLDFRARRLEATPPAPEVRGEPYWVVAGQWLVEGRIGERPALFLLDTGATHTLIDDDWAREAGGRSGSSIAVSGFGGSIPARELSGIAVNVQGVSVPETGMRVVDLAARSRLGGVEVAGCLGLDLLGRHRIVIDTVARRIALEPARDARGSRLAE